MKNTQSQTDWLKSTFFTLLIICMSVLNIHISTSWAAESVVVKKETTTTSTPKKTATTEKKAAEPEPEKTSTSGSALLYGGIGVAAVVAVAAAAGSGGGSDSVVETPSSTTTTTTTTTPTTTTTTPVTTTPKIKKPKDSNPAGTEPVGPDLRGDNWTGYIYVVGAPPASTTAYVHQNQSISASVYQNGNYIRITTSSNLAYGRKLIGNISAGGTMKLYDQKTGEIWSTEKGPASENSIDIYDFVDQFHQLDHIHLVR
ncbi:MAG: hypothetical protein Q8R88_04875 [Desulfoprunum sp.]|nr:hypothetical protein [Desulfoprunum sp.]